MATAISSATFSSRENLSLHMSANGTAKALTFDEFLWSQVGEHQQRDVHFDGALLYGVKTTGIYCRPWCPSRKPKPENVRVFFKPEEAETAGFRACKRCTPKAAKLPADEVQVAQRICEYVEKNLDSTLTTQVLKSALGLSAHQIVRGFPRVVGVSVRDYVEARRHSTFRMALRYGHEVSRATYEAGYGSVRQVYEGVEKRMGMTPSVYRKGGEGMSIGYSVISKSPLGVLLVASTAKGVCKIALGDREADLVEELRREFHKAHIHENEGMCEYVKAVLEHLKGRTPHLDLPLDIRMTAFQRKVWEALCSIPYGETVSYGELARQLHLDGGQRAIARACASNPVALAIPCHRVVQKDGGVGGYRWGVERKKKLLQQETGNIKV